MADPADIIKLTVDMGNSAPAIQAVSKGLEGLAEAGEKAGRSGANTGRSMLELSRIIQDFTAAGLPGIVNNFEGLALALGLGTGVAGVATVAAVGLSLVAGSLKNLWDNLKADDVKAADALARALGEMEDRAGKLKEQLKGLAAQQGPVAKGLRDENAELQTQVDLARIRIEQRDREKKQEEERIVLAEKGRGLPPAGEAGRRAVREEVAGRIEARVGGPEQLAIEQAIRARIEVPEVARRQAEVEQLRGRIRQLEEAPLPADFLRAREEQEARRLQIEYYRRAIREREAEFAGLRERRLGELMGAMRQGDQGAIGRIAGLLPAGPMRAQLQALTPVGRFAAAARDAGFTAQFAAEDAAGAIRRGAGAVGRTVRGLGRGLLRQVGDAENDQLEAMREQGRRTGAIAAGQAEDMRRDDERELARRVAESQAMARRIGQAVRQPAVPAGTPLPAITRGMTDIEAMNAMLANQDALAKNQRELDEFNRRNGVVRRNVNGAVRFSKQPDRNNGHN